MSSSADLIGQELPLALGNFVMAFSRLCGILEYTALLLMCKSGPEDLFERAAIPISGLTAQPLANIVFSLITQARLGRWTEEDLGLMKECRKELNSLIEERNRIAHDVWASIPEESTDGVEVRWGRYRRRLSPTSGAHIARSLITIAEIEIQSQHAERLMLVIQTLAVTAIGDLETALSKVVKISDSGWITVRSSG